MKAAAIAFEQWALRLVCAIALLFVGFAHQIPVIEKDGVRIDVARYVLPDGTLPVFCITESGDGTQKHKMQMEGCQACHINASIILPAPTDIKGVAVTFAPVIPTPPGLNVFVRPLFPPNTGPRAPPSLFQAA